MTFLNVLVMILENDRLAVSSGSGSVGKETKSSLTDSVSLSFVNSNEWVS